MVPAPGNHDAEGGGSMSAKVPLGGTSRRCGVGTLGSTGVSRGLLPGEPGWSRGSTEIQQRTALWTLGPLSGASRVPWTEFPLEFPNLEVPRNPYVRVIFTDKPPKGNLCVNQSGEPGQGRGGPSGAEGPRCLRAPGRSGEQGSEAPSSCQHQLLDHRPIRGHRNWALPNLALTSPRSSPRPPDCHTPAKQHVVMPSPGLW